MSSLAGSHARKKGIQAPKPEGGRGRFTHLLPEDLGEDLVEEEGPQQKVGGPELGLEEERLLVLPGGADLAQLCLEDRPSATTAAGATYYSSDSANSESRSTLM